MIRYGHGVDVRVAITAACATAGTGSVDQGWLCRHQVFDDAAAADALYEQVLSRFIARFGVPPGSLA